MRKEKKKKLQKHLNLNTCVWYANNLRLCVCLFSFLLIVYQEYTRHILIMANFKPEKKIMKNAFDQQALAGALIILTAHTKKLSFFDLNKLMNFSSSKSITSKFHLCSVCSGERGQTKTKHRSFAIRESEVSV